MERVINQADAFEVIEPMCITGKRVLLIDDLIATGGTAVASARLVKDTKANLVEVCFLLNIELLNGVPKVEKIAPVYSILDI